MAVETPTVAHPPTVERAAEHDAVSVAKPNAETGTAQEAQGGLPQFQFQHWAGQIGYLLILFAVLYVLMAKVFTPRIRRVFDERRTTIDTALKTAREVQAEAGSQAEAARQAVTEARSKAQRTALDAKAKSAEEAAKRQAVLEADLQAKLAKAEASIRASRDKALGQVRGIASETASAIVEKLTGTAAPAKAMADALTRMEN